MEQFDCHTPFGAKSGGEDGPAWSACSAILNVQIDPPNALAACFGMRQRETSGQKDMVGKSSYSDEITRDAAVRFAKNGYL